MKVLIAEDEPLSRRLIESTVQRSGFEVVVASNGAEADAILRGADPPRLAILDWMMPRLDGLALCRQVRESREDQLYTYVLLLTAKENQSDVIQGLEAGADDYMIKPFDPRELRVRLRSGKRIICLLEDLTATREFLREMAARDPLTSLWNHNAILGLLQRELSRACRQDAPVGVIMIDLDHFKSINDTWGHLAGDQVIRQTAELLRTVMRPYDAVGRFGGEEFVVVLPGSDRLNSVGHAERLRQAIHRLSVETSSGPIRLTASFGVTVAESAIGTEFDAEALIHAADDALYVAKRNGRNRVEFKAAAEQACSCT